MPVKLLIVDDHPVFLAGLRALLEMDRNIEIVGEAKNGREAVDLQNQLNADIVLMDINMPGINGIEATRQILSKNPITKVLALSNHSGKRFVKGMLDAGASGYLLKGAVPEELVMAIQKLAQGDMYLSSSITSIALSTEEPNPAKVNILSTKLHRPQITREYVRRSHLIDLLNRNIYKPATLISAGAGYGKSTLISSWLEESKTQYAWVSLGDEDNDIRNLINLLSASVKKFFPKSMDGLSNMLETSVLPPLNLIAESLINDLDEIGEEFVLVLDNYHLIQNNEINELINKLLFFPPQLMHLVILTRRDPYLNISNLRAQSRINEIRGTDLCFMENEIIDLYENIFHAKLKTEIAHKLFKHTEGWIAGLRLTSLIIKSNEDPNEALKNFETNSYSTAGFLLNEVILNQPEYIQDSLIIISILDRFNDELVEELCFSQLENTTEEISGKEVIQMLLDANLFTISLDYEGVWYRFHYLFQELLQIQLKEKRSEEEINSYHLSASQWFDKHNLMEEAVKHAIMADAINEAVDLVTKYRYELINTEQMHRLDLLVNLIPEEIIEQTPAILSSKAFYMDFVGMIPEMMEYKEKAKAIVSQVSGESQEMNPIKGEIELLEGVSYIVFGDWENLIKCSKKALELLPLQAERFLLNAVGYQVVGYQMVLGVESGMEKVKDLLIKFPIRSNFSKVGEQLWHSLVYAMQGDSTKLKYSGLKLLRLGEKYRFEESVVYGRYFVSFAHYMANEFEKAEPYLKDAVNGSFVVRVYYVINSAFMLASIYIDRGELDEASKLLDSMIAKTEEAGSESALIIAKAMQAELAIKANDIHNAILLYEHKDYNANMPPMWFPFVAQLTPIKLKLALNTTEDILEAQQLLLEFEGPIRQTNKKAILIEVLILQAVAFKAQNNDKDALLKISEAIELSSQGNYIRSYIDHKISLKELISSLLESSDNKEHIRKLLEALDDRENLIKKIPQMELTYNPPLLLGAPNYIDELTLRELEVLKLVAMGLRNKEISDHLFIQTGTVKQHLKKIFAKLNVNNRMKAVKKAIDLNIIEKV